MRSKLYGVWSGMRSRCNNPKNQSAKYYHYKGIRVCEEWDDFKEFEKWSNENGYSEGMTIDRIDHDGNYCPENCQWIPPSENARKVSQEKTGIWDVIPYFSDDLKAVQLWYLAGLLKPYASDLSYSEALKFRNEMCDKNGQTHRLNNYRIINKYGEFRKLK